MIDNISRRCQTCRNYKGIDNYRHNEARADGYAPHCRSCERKLARMAVTAFEVSDPAMSHDEIATALQCTRQRVWQIERQAIMKLRKAVGL